MPSRSVRPWAFPSIRKASRSAKGTGTGQSPHERGSGEAFAAAPYHTQFVCGTVHHSLPNDNTIQAAYTSYLTRGATPEVLPAPCAVDGGATYIFGHLAAGGIVAAKRGRSAERSVIALAEAEEEGLAEVVETHEETIVLTNAVKPVTLALSGEDLHLVYEPNEDGKTARSPTVPSRRSHGHARRIGRADGGVRRQSRRADVRRSLSARLGESPGGMEPVKPPGTGTGTGSESPGSGSSESESSLTAAQRAPHRPPLSRPC